MMAGIPVAVSNQPEKRQIVEKYEIGATFNPTDPKDIAHTINGLLENEKEYKLMCENARQTAKNILNWDIESRKLIGVYERLSK